jgi:drug/metabolite transporter (DMT)-like permease
VALAAGVIVLNEPLTPWNVAALVLILVGCVLDTHRRAAAPAGAATEPTQAAPR